jgi:hypothetical protein
MKGRSTGLSEAGYGRRRRLFARACMALLVLTALLVAGAGSASASETPCPNEAIRGEQHSTYLPDCRAYEQVSPPYKEGFAVPITGISQDGSRLMTVSAGALGGTLGGLEYEIVRAATGWETSQAPLGGPLSEFPIWHAPAATPDFQSTLFEATSPANPESWAAYLRPPGGSLAPVGPLEPPEGKGNSISLLGVSADLRRSLWYGGSSSVCVGVEPTAIWPGDTTNCGTLETLYEYQYTGAEATEPTLVGIDNVGVPKSVGEGHLISNCGTAFGSSPSYEGDTYNAVSASGAAVFFTSHPCGEGGPPVDELYARMAETPSAPAHTVAISESTKADCEACETYEVEPQKRSPATFQGASEDGSKVFFLSNQELLEGAKGQNLYEYDFDNPGATKVLRVSTGSTEPKVLGVARVSEDGSHVYFVAEGVLTAENGEQNSPLEGEHNLYVFERDAAHPQGRLAFVATLSPADARDWSVEDRRPVQATPDGRFLVFQSTADLTSDQHGLPEAGQIFEYDSQSETLVRVSHGQEGFGDDGNSAEYAATIPRQEYTRGGNIKGDVAFMDRALSADGSSVFFESHDALTKQALGGFPNVYEYHAGQVGLISDGYDNVVNAKGVPAVKLIGTDESGHDVFFATADRLVQQDTDTLIDVYDAPAEGGFPPPPPLPFCSEEACQGTQSQAPSELAPATPTFSGTGNSPPSHHPKHHKHHKKRHGHRTNANRGGQK